MSAMPEIGTDAADTKSELRRALAGLVAAARTGRLDPAGLRAATTDLYEHLLAGQAAAAGIEPGSGLALVAFGSLGRREMLPFSDVDLVLIHRDGAKHVPEHAAALWYPLWDAGVKLDYSVRTPRACKDIMTQEPKVALSMLECRCIAGDTELAATAIGELRRTWQRTAGKVLDTLVAELETRRELAGAVAHRLAPDLKNGAGGLRDAQVLAALADAQLADAALTTIPDAPGMSFREARGVLLDVRTLLQVVAGRREDVLHAQYAEDVAHSMGLEDRFVLAQRLSAAARTVAFATDLGLRTARNAVPRRGPAALRRAPARYPLAHGVVEQAGEVVLARDVRPERDPGLLLRVATAAARTRLPIGAGTLRRLAQSAPTMSATPEAEHFADLAAFLGTGRAAIEVIETLDRCGLWDRILPEWDAIRDLPSRSATHIYTVDRHLVEVAAAAARLATRTDRPDLLLLAALVHDLGKGRDRDHSELGAELSVQVAGRLGLDDDDARRLAGLVRHHLLLAATITNRDPGDPDTAAAVVDTLGADRTLLELLALLTEADSRGTGPGVWSAWKAEMLATLVAAARPLCTTGAPEPDFASAELVAAAIDDAGPVRLARRPGIGRHDFAATTSGGTPGLSGLLAVLDSRDIGIVDLVADSDPAAAGNGRDDDGARVVQAIVTTRFGDPSPAALIAQDLRSAHVVAQRRRKTRESAQRRQQALVPVVAPPEVNLELSAAVDGAPATWALHIRAQERAGLLSDLVHVAMDRGWAVPRLRARTRAGFAVDTIEVTSGPHGPAGRAAAEQLAEAVVDLLPHPPKPQAGHGDRPDW